VEAGHRWSRIWPVNVPERVICDFAIDIAKRDDSSFEVLATSHRTGASATSSFRPLISEESILRLSYKMAGNRQLTRARYYTDEDRRLAKTVGTALFNSILGDEARTLFHDDVEWANSEDAIVRISLDLSKTPDLLNYPWEFLYDPVDGTYLARSSNTTLFRSMSPLKMWAQKRSSRPMRVLLISSKPDGLPMLRIDDEVTNLKNVAEGLRDAVVFDHLANPMLLDVKRHLDAQKRGHYDILHFIGHGGFNRDSRIGSLSFANNANAIDDVDPERFGDVVKNRGIQLVILNACEGGRTDAGDPFAGMALHLLRARFAAVIAMQFEITDSAAIDFSRELYRGIARNAPIDVAVSHARGEVSAMQETLEWATPVLYLRAPEMVLFDVAEPIGEPSRASAAREAQHRADQAVAAPLDTAKATQANPLDHPDVVEHVSERFRALLRRVDQGEEAARGEALRPAAAIVDALAATGLLEFAYLAPGEGEDDGPIVWLEASEAIVDKERDSVIVAGSEVLKVFEGPVTIEDPAKAAKSA
jgi:CHAT domain